MQGMRSSVSDQEFLAANQKKSVSGRYALPKQTLPPSLLSDSDDSNGSAIVDAIAGPARPASETAGPSRQVFNAGFGRAGGVMPLPRGAPDCNCVCLCVTESQDGAVASKVTCCLLACESDKLHGFEDAFV